jgi:membrane-associated phospholipid phosphatase
MSSFDPAPESSRAESSGSPAPHGTSPDRPSQARPSQDGAASTADSTARVSTIVWGLVVLALAILIIISQLGLVVLNGTYVLIGLMIGAGAALVIGGLLSARRGDNGSTNGKA